MLQTEEIYTEKFKEQVTNQIIDSLTNGKNVNLKGTLHDGRSNYMRFFSINTKLHKKYKKFFNSIYPVYLDLSLLTSNEPQDILIFLHLIR